MTRNAFIIFVKILVIFIISSVDGAPRKTEHVNTPNTPKQLDNDKEQNYHVIDESQNGTENYRISVKDIVVIVAPEDSFLAAASLLIPQLATGLSDHFFEDDLSPPVSVDISSPSTSEPEEIKPIQVPTSPAPASSSRLVKKPQSFVQTGRSDSSERVDYPILLGPFLKRIQPKH